MTTNDNRPLISVVINCYNGEQFVQESIESVFKQTYENWEIIFWDNVSSDKSADIVKTFKDKRIKYYKPSIHSRLGRARNLAMEKTSGEWCAFLDSDDQWLPDKLEKQVEILINDSSSLGVVYGQMLAKTEINQNKSLWLNQMKKYSRRTLFKKLPEGEVFNMLLHLNFVPLLTAIFRRDLFFKVGGVSEHLEISEDYDLFLKLSKLSRFRAVQGTVAHYRLHDKNISIGKQEQDFKETCEIIKNYLPDKAVKSSLKMHSTIRAIQKIKSGLVFEGISQFLRDGSIKSLFTLIKFRFI